MTRTSRITLAIGLFFAVGLLAPSGFASTQDNRHRALGLDMETLQQSAPACSRVPPPSQC
jgi:hypothetical protein